MAAAVGSTEPPELEPPGLDLPAVQAWLERRPGGSPLVAPVTAELIAGGRSNLSYLLTGGDGTRFVLRRPPLGHVLATAHDMGRESRVMAALAGSAVPVPQVLAVCPDGDVTGAPWYLMSHVDGLVVRSAHDLTGTDGDQRAALARAMIDVLADLHAVDVDAVGLSDFGRPQGFLQRQLRRWSQQLDASRSRDLPGIDQLRDELAATVPSQPNESSEPSQPSDPSEQGGPSGPIGAGNSAGSRSWSLVHGDYRLDNLVIDPDPATWTKTSAKPVRAVLDWEMATLGDPLADLGLLLAYWEGLGRLPGPVVGGVGPGAGMPDGAVLRRWYGERSGRDLSRLDWYLGFGYFKIAVILEGIHYRYQAGATVGPGFEAIGPLVPALVHLGRQNLLSSR